MEGLPGSPRCRPAVIGFVAARPTESAAALAPYFAPDATYVNGPLDPVHGRAAICAELAGFMALGGEVDVDMRRVVAAGGVVMTERVDYFKVAGRTISLPVAGVFEIRGTTIAAWRDYFDLATIRTAWEDGPPARA